jgi:hypothetical protein
MKATLLAPLMAALAVVASIDAAYANSDPISQSAWGSSSDRSSNSQTEVVPVTPTEPNYQPAINSDLETNYKTTFRCDYQGGIPVTVVKTPQGEQNLLNWYQQYFPNEATAQELCQSVTKKLQYYADSGELQQLSLSAGKIENDSVVCLTGNGNNNCTARDIKLFDLEANSPAQALSHMISEDVQHHVEAKPTTRGGHFSLNLSLWRLF